jgi:hypothetical protein
MCSFEVEKDHFEAALIQNPGSLEEFPQKDPAKTILAAVKLFSTDPGIFMSYWYGSLYVVIEGWKQLRLRDPKIDPLLLSPNVSNFQKRKTGPQQLMRGEAE